MRRRIAYIVASVALGAASFLVVASPASAALDTTGQWGSVMSWPVIPINAALTTDGKVMSFGTDTAGVQGGQWNYDVWTPSTGAHVLSTNSTFTDLFCSVQVLDPVRDVIFTAGGDDSRNDANYAPVGFTSYSTATGILNEAPMNFPRWYPSATVMPNGEIVVEGGSFEGVNGPGVMTPERYTPGIGWTSLTGATSTYAYGNDQKRWWYPRTWVAPNGKIFGLSGSNMYYLDPAGAGSITAAGTFPGGNIAATSSALMYRPGKILQVGGGAFDNGMAVTASAAATTVDINGATPVVTSVPAMNLTRHWANSTVLPTGEVFVNGGANGNNNTDGVRYQPEMWNPDTNTWTLLPAETQMRLYHSTTLLLPDGRVLVGGGGAPGPQGNLNAQIYSPPYLFDGNSPAPRPTITTAPTQIGYGQSFGVTVSSGATRATLVRAGAVTHSFNAGQRFMELTMTGSGTSRTITAPANGAVAPPGLYLLFVLDAAGTPSVATLVNIDPVGGGPSALADGFEDGAVATPNGWINYVPGNTFGPWTVTSAVSRDQAGHHGGLGTAGHHLDLDDDGSVNRTVTGLIPGTAYNLTLKYARHKSTAGPVSARVQIAGLNHVWSAANPSGSTFAGLSQSFTAAATSHQLTLSGVSSTSGCCGMVVDDLTIAPATMPALQPLLVDGLESGATAAPGGYVAYGPGSTFGPWNVTSDVSRDQAGHHVGLGFVGHHLDLDDNGSVNRSVTGFVVGRTYQLSLRYARHKAVAATVSGNVSIAGLNHTWSASNSTADPFATLKVTFTATAATHTLTISGVSSPSGCCGMVVDNIVIWQVADAGATALSAIVPGTGTEAVDHSLHHHPS